MGIEKNQSTIAWSKWYLVKDKDRMGNPVFKIRRYYLEGSKTIWERYPAKNYRYMAEQDVEALLRRLNATFEVDRKAAEDRYNFDHTYINQITLEKFRKYLEKQVTDQNAINTVFQMLNDYAFEFFVIQCKLPDPSRWHLKEDEFGDFLLSHDLSAATLKKIVGTINRFNTYLVQKLFPEMATPRKLQPLGKKILEGIEESRITNRKTKYISDDVFSEIIDYAQKNHPEIVPNIKLCKAFGFRISETLGLSKDKFLKDSILVNQQGDSVKDGKIVRKKVKTTDRRVPYWNMTAREAWALVQEIKVMHPNTLVRKVNKCLEPFDHTSHDFRRTFITNSFRKAHWKDVMSAAGHSDVRTTMGYNQDDRNLSNEKADLD